MRVVIFAHDFFPLIGGAQLYAHLLAKGLVEAGHTAQLVTNTESEQKYDSRFTYPVVRRPAARRLWRIVGQADVAEFTGPVLLPLFFAICRGKPVIIEHHGYQASCPNGVLLYEPTKTACPGHFLARRYRECLRCNAVTCGWMKSLRMLLSTFPRRWLCRLASVNAPVAYKVNELLRLPRSQVIYHGVEDPLLSNPLVLAAPVSRPSPTFAYLGRLASEKGLPVLIEAVALLKQRGRSVRLKLIADGPERPHLEALAANRGVEDQIAFLGFLQEEAIERALADVIALVVPSIWEETAGFAAMEQMMRSRVIVASDIGGLTEVVDGAGLKFAPGDAEALAACLERLLDHPELAAELGRKARQRAQNMFRYERVVSDHLGLYARLARA